MRNFFATVALGALVLTCSAGDAPPRAGFGGGGGSSPNGGLGTGGSNFGGGGGTSIIGSAGAPGSGTDGSAVPPLSGTLTTSAGDTITVSGPTMVPYTLTTAPGNAPSSIKWSVDNPTIGTIDADGVLHIVGTVGGVIVVTASAGGRNLSVSLTVNVDIMQMGGVAQGDQTALRAGGAAESAFRWLYPYDKTVFPRGLSAPVLQLGGTAATAKYLKITTAHFTYQGYAGATAAPLQITIPPAIWTGVTATARATDLVEVSVTKLSGGQASGPATESWYVAQDSLKGVIYYSTYRSPLTGGVTAPNGGGLLRIRPGQQAEVVQPIPRCAVCHSVSANGAVLSLARDNQPDQDNEWNPVDSSTYDLGANGNVTLRTSSGEGRIFAMAGLSPDGSLAMTTGLPPTTWSPFVEHGVYSGVGFPTRLDDTRTALPIAAPTLTSNVTYAITPVFSADGAHVAFVNGDKVTPGCNDVGSILSPTCRHVLTMLDADLASSPPSFANPVDLIDQSGGGKLVAWPTFLPDSKGIIYHEGDSFDSCGFNTDANALSAAMYAEVKLIEMDTRTVKPLNALNGRNAAGQLYLPYGDTVEGRMDYEPNVLPIAVGGYYWVLFTSRRVFGNTIGPDGAVRTISPPTNPIAPGAHDPWGDASAPSWRKKIWIAAIDIDHGDKTDPSHPAFLLPGQELESANMRAFGALPPCKPDGQACESGSDCCNGFCRQSADGSGSGGPVCVPPPVNTCSLTDEPCDPALCCKSTDLCINHRCTAPPPAIVH
jgi:hypothetical protein